MLLPTVSKQRADTAVLLVKSDYFAISLHLMQEYQTGGHGSPS